MALILKGRGDRCVPDSPQILKHFKCSCVYSPRELRPNYFFALGLAPGLADLAGFATLEAFAAVFLAADFFGEGLSAACASGDALAFAFGAAATLVRLAGALAPRRPLPGLGVSPRSRRS